MSHDKKLNYCKILLKVILNYLEKAAVILYNWSTILLIYIV